MMSQGQAIYLMRSGEQTGPFTENDLRRYWGYGSVSDDDLVWAPGMADYVTLEEYFKIHSTRRVAKKMPKTLVLQGGSEALNMAEWQESIDWQTNAWVFQAMGWILLLVATGFWISFPKQVWIALVIYTLATGSVVAYLAIRRSVGGWLALTCTVALPVALWLYLGSQHPHDKSGAQMPVSTTLPTEITIPYSKS